MTALAPINASPLSLESLRMSTPLCALLVADRPADGAVADIVADPVLHTEARVLAPMLAEVAKGCGDDAVRRALQPLVLVFGVSEAARSPAFWTVYVRNLADLPAEAVAKAVDEYAGLPDSEFFPKPGPLRALALKHAEPILKAASRAKRAAETDRPKPIDRGTAEERRALAAEVKARLGITIGTGEAA